jgi:hypothetical protein
MGYGLLCLNPDTAYGLERMYWIVRKCTLDKVHSNFKCYFSRSLLVGGNCTQLSYSDAHFTNINTEYRPIQQTVHFLDTFLLMYVNYAQYQIY